MILIKNIYNFYRNRRSAIILLLNRLIYSDSFSYGKNVYVRKGFVVTIEESGYVQIGNNCFFNNNCSINCLEKISIGDDCIFGENVHIYDHNHIYIDQNIPINSQGFKCREVKIGSNCWIGTNVVILRGVTVGDHCVIGAGCVVYKDIPSNSIVINQQVRSM